MLYVVLLNLNKIKITFIWELCNGYMEIVLGTYKSTLIIIINVFLAEIFYMSYVTIN